MHVDPDTGVITPTIVRNSFNYHLNRSLPRPLTRPSRTIPDQVLTIEEILRRYARNFEAPPDPTNAVYDSPYPDISRMDRLDKRQLAFDIKENVEAYKQAAKAAADQAERDAKDAKPEPITDPPAPMPAPPPS